MTAHTITVAPTPVQKPSISKLPTSQLVRNSISRLTKNSAIPSVTMMKGIESTVTTGFTTMLTRLKTSPATISVTQKSPPEWTPSSSFVATQRAAVLHNHVTRKRSIASHLPNSYET